MIFSSLSYFIFLPIVFAVYWLSPERARKFILLVASYIFYMSWLPVYGLLLFGLTVVNYFIGLAIEKNRKSGWLLALTLFVNLGALGYYKYTNFFINTLVDVCKSVPFLSSLPLATNDHPVLNIILPLGISFFVFEFIHYTVDIRRGSSAIKNPIDFALFSAFFPSQIAGPIKRYQQFDQQLNEAKVMKKEDLVEGLAYITKGLFKKVALADNMGMISQLGAVPGANLGTADAWVVMFCFLWQLYFDFSGYTDMGIGSARLLGFHIPNNFDLPFVASKNLIEFWQRWHITLSTWLGDYVLTPLKGRRPSRTKFNICSVITMLVCGLWHGAAWHFVAWGLMNGLLLVVTREYVRFTRETNWLKAIHAQSWTVPVACFGTFLQLCLFQSFFIAPTIPDSFDLMKAMLLYSPSTMESVSLLCQSPCVVAGVLYCIYGILFVKLPYMPDLPVARIQQFLTANTSRRVAICAAICVVAVAFSPDAVSPFIYFQF